MARPILYSAWFCPFAQKSWIAMLHKKVDFEYREQNPYDRTPEWLAINPRGLVPVLVVDGNAVIESGIINEFAEEAWPDSGGALLPPRDAPFRRAEARLWLDFVNKRLIAPCYKLLQSRDEASLASASREMIRNVKTFSEGMDPEGPFFAGDDLSLVDVAFIPWALRLYIMEELKGFRLPAEEEEEWSRRFRRWREAAETHPSVTPTIQDREKLLKSHRKLVEYWAAEPERAAAATAAGI